MHNTATLTESWSACCRHFVIQPSAETWGEPVGRAARLFPFSPPYSNRQVAQRPGYLNSWESLLISSPGWLTVRFTHKRKYHLLLATQIFVYIGRFTFCWSLNVGANKTNSYWDRAGVQSIIGIYWMRITSRHAHSSLKPAVLVLSSLFISLICHNNFLRKNPSHSSLILSLFFFPFCFRNRK